MRNAFVHGVRKGSAMKRAKNRVGERNRKVFYALLLAFPVLQFIIFYVCVNLNSILLAFKVYDYDTGAYSFAGFSNFTFVFNQFGTVIFQSAIKNSLILYVFTLGIGVTLALLFSYYIHKRFPGHSVFKVILFLPSVISAVAMVLTFKYFTERAIPAAWESLFDKEIEGLLANPNTTKGTLIFYTLWAGFGTQILMYIGAMNNVSDSVKEAAQLDGAGALREFFYIIIPSIYPTIVTFIVVGVAGIFTHQMNLYSFYGTSAAAELYTFGYYLYVHTKVATSYADFPELSALGIVLTVVAVAMTMTVKYLLEKFGPSTD